MFYCVLKVGPAQYTKNMPEASMLTRSGLAFLPFTNHPTFFSFPWAPRIEMLPSHYHFLWCGKSASLGKRRVSLPASSSWKRLETTHVFKFCPKWGKTFKWSIAFKVFQRRKQSMPYGLGVFFSFFFFSFLFFGLNPWHMEIPRLGVDSELQLPAYARDSNVGSEPRLPPIPQLTATPDPWPTERGQGSNPQPHGC